MASVEPRADITQYKEEKQQKGMNLANDNNTDVTQEEMRNLLAKVWHTDGEVSTLKNQVNGIIESLQRIESGMLNKPPIWNMNTVLTLVIAVGGVLFGISQIVDSRISALAIAEAKRETHESAAEVKLDAWKQDKDQFQRQTHYELGVQITENKHYDRMVDVFEGRIEKNADRINQLCAAKGC